MARARLGLGQRLGAWAGEAGDGAGCGGKGGAECCGGGGEGGGGEGDSEGGGGGGGGMAAAAWARVAARAGWQGWRQRRPERR